MFLRHIRFSHFKVFSHLELSFVNGDGTTRLQTLLTGENGMGKTALLQGIALLTAGSRALENLIIDPANWVSFGKKEATLQAIIQNEAGEEKTIMLTIRTGRTIQQIIEQNSASLTMVDEMLSNNASFFTIAYGATRRLNKNNQPSPLDTAETGDTPQQGQNIATLFDSDAQLQPLATWLLGLSRSKEWSIVKNAMNPFLPGVALEKWDKKTGNILFTIENQTGTVPLQLLSQGHQNVASWVGDLLYRMNLAFGSINPQTATGLLLIDALDLHLHPQWQRFLLDFIQQKLPRFQLVATTYSPLTAQQADEGELFVLAREAGEIKLTPFVGSPRLMQINQLLMSPMFNLTTDESLQVENLKAEYLALRSDPTQTKTTRFKKVKQQIEELPVQPLKSDVFLKEKTDLIARLSQKANIANDDAV